MKKIKLDELVASLGDFFPDVTSTKVTVCAQSESSASPALESSGLGEEPFDQYTGKVSGTPKNPEIQPELKCEGGSKITEPNAGITSDMTKRGDEKEKTRWSINAYPNDEKKLTPPI